MFLVKQVRIRLKCWQRVCFVQKDIVPQKSKTCWEELSVVVSLFLKGSLCLLEETGWNITSFTMVLTPVCVGDLWTQPV